MTEVGGLANETRDIINSAYNSPLSTTSQFITRDSGYNTLNTKITANDTVLSLHVESTATFLKRHKTHKA